MSKTFSKTGLRRKSILIVDDNRNMQLFLAGIAEAIGLDAVPASTLKESVALCDRRAFDVAIVDKCLVERDKQNRDGIILLKHIATKNEGTHSILLTGYGEYEDATEAVNELSAGIMIKKTESAAWEMEMRERITQAAASSQLGAKIEFPAQIFCGDQNSVTWEDGARKILKPPEWEVLNSLLSDLAQTTVPMFERYGDNGVQQTQNQSVMAGLYWSRGVGEAVAVLLAHGELPSEIPRFPNWPANLSFSTFAPPYQAQRKAKGGSRLTGAIIKCEGVNPTDFTVPRS